jgi:hypothetical protein
MNLPPRILAEARRYERARPRALHRSKIALARLVASEAPPQALQQLELAAEYVRGNASAEELARARQDSWAYIGSLACYCSVSDSASSQAILNCLESDDGAHTLTSLIEHSQLVVECGVSEDRIVEALAHESLTEEPT